MGFFVKKNEILFLEKNKKIIIWDSFLVQRSILHAMNFSFAFYSQTVIFEALECFLGFQKIAWRDAIKKSFSQGFGRILWNCDARFQIDAR